MAKVIKFPGAPQTPEKFGPQRVLKQKPTTPEKHGQLNLFTGGKIVRMNQLSPLEEALLLEERGNYDDAREVYRKIIEAGGESLADAYCNLGIMESEDCNYVAAIDYFTQCLKLEPRHFEAHYNLANAYAEMGNTKLAKLHYLVSIEIEPDFPNSYYNLGIALALNNEFRESIEFLNKYKDKQPREDHAVLNGLIEKMLHALD